jgi:hypothetical protein
MAAFTGAMVGPELARMGEHGRPILGEVFVQQDLVLASRTSPSRDRFGGDLVEGPVRRFRRFGLLCHAASIGREVSASTEPRPLPKLLGVKDRTGRDAQLHPTQQANAGCSGGVPAGQADPLARSPGFAGG